MSKSLEKEQHGPDASYPAFVKYEHMKLDMMVSDDMMVQDLLANIMATTSLDGKRDFVLIYKQKEMQVGVSMKAYYMEKNTTIHMVLKGLEFGGARGVVKSK